MKKIFYFLAVIVAALLITSCSKEPKATTVNVHVQLSDGTPVAERVVFYTADKAVYQKAMDTKDDKDPLWLPSEDFAVSDAQGLAKVVLQLEKSQDMYFLVRHPLVNMYNGTSTFVFKGFDMDLNLKVGE